MSAIWEMNTRQALGNVEKGLRIAHDGLDMLQDIVNKARDLLDAGDHEGVEICVNEIESALGGFECTSRTRAT